MQNNKKNKRLPMPNQVKRGFHCYCTMVLIVALMGCCSVTALAADDPLTVINNLSDFIFGLIRASFRWASHSKAMTHLSALTAFSRWQAALL